MRSSYNQLAVFLTERGTPEEGLPFTLKSLAIHSELHSPNVRIDLHFLSRQRELLGEERFLNILREQLNDNEAVQTVLRLLQEDEANDE